MDAESGSGRELGPEGSSSGIGGAGGVCGEGGIVSLGLVVKREGEMGLEWRWDDGGWRWGCMSGCTKNLSLSEAPGSLQ